MPLGLPLSEEFRSAGYDPRLRPWYQAASAAGRAVWSRPHTLVSTGESAMSAVVPVYSQGRIRAVATAEIGLGRLSSFLSSISSVEGGFAIILDSLGGLVAASDLPPGRDSLSLSASSPSPQASTTEAAILALSRSDKEGHPPEERGQGIPRP